jgi:Calcineurin-like phosphoesterase
MIIAQISDTHLAFDAGDAEQRLRDFTGTILEINALDPPPDVIVHTGDIVHNGRQDEYAQAAAILAKARAPVFVLAGNKDDPWGFVTEHGLAVQLINQPRGGTRRRCLCPLDQKAEGVAGPRCLEQLIARLPAISLEIGDRARIGGDHFQSLARRHVSQRLVRFHHRQGAFQPFKIEEMVGHVTFRKLSVACKNLLSQADAGNSLALSRSTHD